MKNVFCRKKATLHERQINWPTGGKAMKGNEVEEREGWPRLVDEETKTQNEKVPISRGIGS